MIAMNASWEKIRGNRALVVSAVILIITAAAAMIGPLVSPHDYLSTNFEELLRAPTMADMRIFGTDDLGRDLFVRTMLGIRVTLIVAIIASIVSLVIGVAYGAIAGYFGGRIDLIFQHVMDVFLAFPSIIMALVVVSVLGTGLQNVIIAIMLPMIPQCARVVRSSALSIREIPYVDAARALGYSHARIILRHMVPNVMAPYLIMITAFVGQAILLEASLSFLGLGVQDPVPAWGLMLRNAQEFIRTEPWIAIWPGVAISLGVFGFNLFGDAVRDALDPKLRTQ